MWSTYSFPASIDETLHLLGKNSEATRIVAGATDLILEMERGTRKHIDSLIDISRLPNLDYIDIDNEGTIHIGPLVTHNDAISSRLLRDHAFPLVSAAWQVGAPQIRNRGTIAGNLITASPANDTIPPLVAMRAWVTLVSSRATRRVPLAEFYTGVRKTVIQPDEMLVDIAFRSINNEWKGTFLKLGLRRAQAISLVNTAVLVNQEFGVVNSAVITLGSVAPTIMHALEAESFLVGKELTDEVISTAGQLAASAARPIDDIRGSAAYRQEMVRILVMRALRQLRDDSWKNQVPERPILLSSSHKSSLRQGKSTFPGTISTRINGKEYTFTDGYKKNLLRLIREDAGLTGTKEGCAEGECGACTIFLDGKAVMACLIPAPCADGSEIETIEGLSSKHDGTNTYKGLKLHPVQQAFISTGAVQCGYCTPGFVMSAAKLLEENAHPSREQVTQALTGNLCRCTGYYKIIEAVEAASRS